MPAVVAAVPAGLEAVLASIGDTSGWHSPTAPGLNICLSEAHVHEAGIADRILDIVVAPLRRQGHSEPH